jgi:tRNA-uridine 2-sulfurtransferase
VNLPANKKQKVFVGMSGGVDSSVSALLLKKQGYDVTGVFIRAWHPDFLPCNWRSEMRDAMRVCAKLKIPFLLCNLEKEYKKNVVDYLINEYKKGRTPNPDILCNKTIKFGHFLDWSLLNGADFIATGHYALKKIIDNKNAVNEINHHGLFSAADQDKDQTYFLWSLNEKQINHTLFPVGNLKKVEVRRIAQKNKLHNAAKKDSQGVCFLGQVDMKNFLRRYIKVTPGVVVGEDGKELGKHDGVELFTIGERHGLKINQHNQNTETYYITDRNFDDGTITVSKNNTFSKSISRIDISGVNFIPNDQQFKDTLVGGLDVLIKLRHRGSLIPAKIHHQNNEYFVKISNKIANVAPGQSVVFYLDNRCLGGGVIDKTS